MANDFSGDSNCIALWNFESGALTTDSKGSNTLTDVNSPTADGDCQEGSYSALLVNTSHQFFKIEDANLDSGFPLKSGDSTKTATFIIRTKLTTHGNARQLITKGGYVPGELSFWSCIHNQFDTLILYWGYDNGVSFYTYDTGIYIPLNAWTSIAIRIDGVNKTLSARVYRYDNSSVYTYSATPASELSLNTNEFRIGGSEQSDTDYTLDGRVDECIVFDKVLTDEEIDVIREGEYPNVDYYLKSSSISAMLEVQEEHKLISSSLSSNIEYQQEHKIKSSSLSLNIEYPVIFYRQLAYPQAGIHEHQTQANKRKRQIRT